MTITFEKKNIKIKYQGMKLKNNKFNTINRLKITLQFCKASTSFEVEEREIEGRRKIVIQALSCPCGWHVPTHRIKGGMLLRISYLKVTNNHLKVTQVPSKEHGCLPPINAYFTHTCLLFFFIYKKTITPLTPTW